LRDAEDQHWWKPGDRMVGLGYSDSYGDQEEDVRIQADIPVLGGRRRQEAVSIRRRLVARDLGCRYSRIEKADLSESGHEHEPDHNRNAVRRDDYGAARPSRMARISTDEGLSASIRLAARFHDSAQPGR